MYYIIFWRDAVKQGKAGKEELQILLIISYRLKKSDNSLEQFSSWFRQYERRV